MPGIGDLVWHQPVLAALARHHGAPIILFARPSSHAASLFHDAAFCAEVVAFERTSLGLLALIAKLRRHRLDTLYLLSNRPTLAAAVALAGVPNRYGLGAPSQMPFLNRGRSVYDRGTPAYDTPVPQCREFLARNLIVPADPVPSLTAAPSMRDAIRAMFADAPRPWTSLGVTATQAARRWPPDRFAELAISLHARHGGTIFLHGAPHQRGILAQVTASLPPDAGWAIDLSQSTMPFAHLIALLAESDLFIGNDSGPLNLSAALGTPSFGLFGNAAPHASLSPRIQAILPDGGPPDERDGMARLAVARVRAAVDGALMPVA